jgi:hypothetical protein
MNQILAKRYAFCDFSSIVGFPNQVPTRDEWENNLPRFQGEEWEVPAEHLLDFHDYMHRLQVVHEDVQIRLFCFSLEGIARDWYRSLPNASISSLAKFHAAFHLFCKTKFSTDLLYPECCHEFSVLNKDLNNYEKIVAAEDISHHDQEIGHPHHDNHSDAFVIASNASPDLCCHEEEIVPVENLKSEEQILISASDSFRSAEDEEDSLPFPDLQGLSNLQLEHENHDQECVDVVVDTSHESFDLNYREDPNPGVESAAHVMGSPHFSDLQTKANCSTYEESDGGEELNSPDQQSIVYVSPTDLEQPAFNNVISKGSFQYLFNLQLEQQSKEVFLDVFNDPIADYLEFMNNINVKIFPLEEGWFCHPFKMHFCILGIPLLFGSRSRRLSVNHPLTWLHWKHDFT